MEIDSLIFHKHLEAKTSKNWKKLFSPFEISLFSDIKDIFLKFRVEWHFAYDVNQF